MQEQTNHLNHDIFARKTHDDPPPHDALTPKQLPKSAATSNHHRVKKLRVTRRNTHSVPIFCRYLLYFSLYLVLRTEYISRFAQIGPYAGKQYTKFS